MSSERIDIGYMELQPIGKRKIFGHIHYADKPHGWGEIEVDAFPPSPQGKRLRDLRVSLGIGLREASRLFGLTAVQLSRVERGGAVVDWIKASRVLESARRSA